MMMLPGNDGDFSLQQRKRMLADEKSNIMLQIPDIIPQISPCRIHPVYQSLFIFPAATFNLLLSFYCVFNAMKALIPNYFIAIVFLL
jgi:hypothetical protein